MTSNTEKLLQELGQQYEGATMQPLYTAVVTVTPGPEGHARLSSHARSSDGLLDLNLAFPAELGGHGQGTNPEQLFAAGYAACFHGALALVSRKAGVDASKATVTCSVTIGRDPTDGGYMLAAKLTVEIPGADHAKAEQAVAQAHQLCPYSKAIRGNVDVQVTVV
ncbi:organic hydroperoxide resistance protein [Leptolyngbya sp. FACHB-261]|uniref:organic hydroperoxide resistance protein n=1 Tax=Leptolyngbya sp. FACHB-261 TaxID=2692806 RepID=UPI00168833D8|nr:organic hydroperoxide resistance protein [Leptolyngbya sp. FACHB-261]MBD2104833.1 organic hydroperoxide resistance protein [Leptolyngbya sp. FACHB-261]